MKTKIVLAALAALVLILLCGCQPTPDSAVVASKNDGALEAALEVAAATPSEVPEDMPAPNHLGEVYTDTFTNTDGDITFNVELERPEDTAAMPVLRIRPKTITPDFARRAAEALFGDADIYTYSEETASVTEKLCDFAFHPYNEEWYRSFDPEYTGDFKTQYLFAASERDGLPYLFTVRERDEANYREHIITCKVNTDLLEPGVKIAFAREPSEEEIEAARAEAQALLDAMEPEHWVIDSCEAEDDPFGYYTIVATACPVYNGVKVTHQQQLSGLELFDAYASNVRYEEAVFTFGAGGRLSSFEYTSPMEVVEEVNENVAYLSFEEAVDIGRTRLRMSVLKATLYGSERFYGADIFYTNAASRVVNIFQAELGLTRTRIKDNATDFYLLPAYTFRATYTLYDRGGNLLVDSNDIWPSPTRELVVVNAVDGSVINTELGY